MVLCRIPCGPPPPPTPPPPPPPPPSPPPPAVQSSRKPSPNGRIGQRFYFPEQKFPRLDTKQQNMAPCPLSRLISTLHFVNIPWEPFNYYVTPESGCNLQILIPFSFGPGRRLICEISERYVIIGPFSLDI